MNKKLLTGLATVFLVLGIVGMVNAAWVQNPTNDHYYDLILTPNNFWRAQNIVQQDYNAHLVTINDVNENQWIESRYFWNESGMDRFY